jgi:predicted metal-dependent HD superfamily phosphohydrolase
MPDFPGAEQFIFEKISRELPSNLSYHGVHHTLDVLAAAMRIAAAVGLDEEEVKLLRVAVYFHDAGFISTYKGHEEVGCQMAKQVLPSFGFDDQMIEQICGMIMATRLPQQPKTVAEQVIADADLDYLGRDDFYPIGETLFHEFRIYLGVSDEQEWNRIQINFLRSHSYHTQYVQELRSTAKAERLKELEALVYTHDR